MVNRSKINQALAKAIAYQECGKVAEAQAWARELVRQLELAEICVLAACRQRKIYFDLDQGEMI